MADQYALENIDDERLARIALCHLMPTGNELTGTLLQDYGAVQTLRYGLGEGLPGDDQATLHVWRSHFEGYDPTEMARGVELAEEHELRVLIPGDPDWPVGLNDLDRQAPYALWIRGDAPELLTRPLSERATLIGRQGSSFRSLDNAYSLATGLSHSEVVVVANSYPGIGRMALACTLGRPGGAIAVLPKGLDRRDTSGPNPFFNQVEENGVLVSETPPGRPTTRDTHLGQLRLVAALSAMTIVIEAAPWNDVVEAPMIAMQLRRIVGAMPKEKESIGGSMLKLPAWEVSAPDDIVRGLEAFARKQAAIDEISRPASASLRAATTALPEQLQRGPGSSQHHTGPSRTA